MHKKYNGKTRIDNYQAFKFLFKHTRLKFCGAIDHYLHSYKILSMKESVIIVSKREPCQHALANMGLASRISNAPSRQGRDTMDFL